MASIKSWNIDILKIWAWVLFFKIYFILSEYIYAHLARRVVINFFCKPRETLSHVHRTHRLISLIYNLITHIIYYITHMNYNIYRNKVVITFKKNFKYIISASILWFFIMYGSSLFFKSLIFCRVDNLYISLQILHFKVCDFFTCNLHFKIN